MRVPHEAERPKVDSYFELDRQIGVDFTRAVKNAWRKTGEVVGDLAGAELGIAKHVGIGIVQRNGNRRVAAVARGNAAVHRERNEIRNAHAQFGGDGTADAEMGGRKVIVTWIGRVIDVKPFEE